MEWRVARGEAHSSTSTAGFKLIPHHTRIVAVNANKPFEIHATEPFCEK